MDLFQYRKQSFYACAMVCVFLTIFGWFSISIDYREALNFKPYVQPRTKLRPFYKMIFSPANVSTTLPTIPSSSQITKSATTDWRLSHETDQRHGQEEPSTFSSQHDISIERPDSVMIQRSSLNAPDTTISPIKDSRLSSRDTSARYSETSATFDSYGSSSSRLTSASGNNVSSESNSIDKERRLLHLSRIQRIQDMCATPSVFESSVYSGRNTTKYYYSDKYDFAYCKVPKCGSTFWTQAFNVLKHGTENANAILKVKRGKVHSNIGEYLTPFSLVQRRETPTILASRDPYSRLYSAFIDKIYLPNIFKTTQNIATRTAKLDDTGCPQNTSFDDFLMYVVNETLKGRTLDRHWAPITSLCRPCDVKPVVLLKQETFAADVEYILEKFRVEKDSRDVLMDALKNNRVQCTIPGIVETIVARTSNERSDANICLGSYEIAHRIWHSFQIQGFLKAGIEFPDLSDTSQCKNATFLSDLIISAIDAYPMTRDESKQQRQQFLVDAYRTVKPTTIKGIQRVFSTDFSIYDYNPEPPANFEIKT